MSTADWYARKAAGQSAPARTVFPPPLDRPTSSGYKPIPTASQSSGTHTANLTENLRNPENVSGPKSQAIMNKPGCPSCGEPGFGKARMDTLERCFSCNYSERFGTTLNAE